MISDTSPEAERVQLELLRRAGMDGRQQMLVELTDEAMDLCLSELGRQHPELDTHELRLRLIERCYGVELAEAVRQHMPLDS